MMHWDQAKCRILFTFFHQLNSWSLRFSLIQISKYKNDCFCFLIYHDPCVVPRSSGVTRFTFFVNIVHDQSPHQFPGAQGVLSKVMCQCQCPVKSYECRYAGEVGDVVRAPVYQRVLGANVVCLFVHLESNTVQIK